MSQQSPSRLVGISATGGAELEARIYPGRIDGNLASSSDREIAIIAHPYGFLGGSLNDHVVQALKDVLCQRSVSVLLYNSRGVGKSSGRASWTGEAERKDYQAVVDWVVDNHRTLAPDRAHEGIDVPSRLVVYCCGYSFGSVMAGQAISPPHRRTGPQVRLRYILISPPVSTVVRFLLTPFRSGNFTASLQRIVSGDGSAGVHEDEAGRESSKVLIIYGRRDNFTSEATYRRWIGEFFPVADLTYRETFSVKEITDADHFWSNSGCKSEMLAEVANWL
ncbi:hypothetical protein NliqN6_2337 [Naganishia liquefaciens]|uniref:AB hydrolase-1 domain-containing protein n=1 Tax=Naganishia liquefaciens TaxID=104408 RepID=A0A8H3TSP2_9TREE|nr:hypothetical protein NliqN6_2337 [Naganishia liquefaciens]